MKKEKASGSFCHRPNLFLELLRLCVGVGIIWLMMHVGNLPGPEVKIPEPPQPQEVRKEPGYEEQLETAREKLKALSEDFSEAHIREYDATVRAVEAILERARKSAGERAKESAAPMQGMGNVAKCIWLGTQDKVSGGSRMEDYIAAAMDPATDLMVETRSELQVTLDAFHQSTKARLDDFEKESLEIAAREGVQLVDLYLDEETFVRHFQAAEDLVHKSAVAVLTTALDVALIQGTLAQIGRLLGPLIGRLAGTATASGTSVLADGPLPIGDIVAAVLALGGTVWTAVDLQQAVQANQALPGLIESVITDQLDHLESGTLEGLDTLGASSDIFVLPQLN
jgi:hypothetical protein